MKTEQVKERQKMGALETAQKKREATTDKILAAVLELEKEKQKITQKAITAKTGLSLGTVRRYWNRQKSAN